MKKITVFFLYATSNVWIPQSIEVDVEYEGVFDKKFEDIKKEAKKLLEKKIPEHSHNAVITGMIHRTSVY